VNTLNFYPKQIRRIYERSIQNSGLNVSTERYHNNVIRVSVILAIISSILFYIFDISMLYSLLVFVFLNLFFYFRVSLKASSRIKKMEQIFPDVISLMASNLRSGITIDRSFMLSARPEFAPLDQEIFKTGREITTGKDVTYAFMNMAKRIDSEKITKTIILITSGIKSGGNISDLLEQTASNMKEKEFIEKKAASNILMYVIFIFFAVSVGSPVLFSLSNVLVGIIINLVAHIPSTGTTQLNLPITFGSISITSNFIMYFSIIFMIFTDLISSLVIGLVNKGESKAGLKFFIPLVVLSLTIFFVIRLVLSQFLGGAFSIA